MIKYLVQNSKQILRIILKAAWSKNLRQILKY